MVKMSSNGVDRLKIHEGYVDHVYQCTAGYNTLGYGHNIDANPLSPYQQECWDANPEEAAEAFLVTDLLKFEAGLYKKKPFVEDFCQPRIDALTNMTYNLGLGWLTSWPNTWRMIENEQWGDVARSIRNSKYATQVGHRAVEMANQLETGDYQFPS